MAIRLYSYWRSSAAYRVRLALNLKGLPYETVAVSLLPENLLAAASIAYGLPLAGAVLGAAGGLYLAAGDVPAALAASVGLAGGILAARQRLSRRACLRRFVPVVSARVPTVDQGRQ